MARPVHCVRECKKCHSLRRPEGDIAVAAKEGGRDFPLDLRVPSDLSPLPSASDFFFAPSFLPLPPIFLREGKGGREGLSKTSPRPVKSNGRRTYKGEEERGKGLEAPLTLREKGKKGALDTKDFFGGEGRGLSDRRRLLILIQPAESRRREEGGERSWPHPRLPSQFSSDIF